MLPNFYNKSQRTRRTRWLGSWKPKVCSSPISGYITHPLADLKSLALQVTTDPDHKFDLAIQLGDLSIALAIAQATPSPESEVKWKAVGDRALATWKFSMARECYEKAGDVGALFLVELALGEKEGLEGVAKDAGEFIEWV